MDNVKEVVYLTIGNPTFCLAFYLTVVRFRGELHNVDHVSEQKTKCGPIKTQ